MPVFCSQHVGSAISLLASRYDPPLLSRGGRGEHVSPGRHSQNPGYRLPPEVPVTTSLQTGG